MADTLRDLIINGAYAAAPVVDDDYSLEELVDAGLSDKEAKKRKIKERSANFQARRAERAGNQGKAESFLRDNDRSFQSTGSFVEQERYPDAFGIERSAVDLPEYSPEDQRAITEETFQNERGNYVTVDRGRGKERLWRENGEFSSEPKYAKNKRVDMADPFVKPTSAPQGAGMGGPNGLATQLADMVVRGQIAETDLVPGSSNKTVGMLMKEMAMEADPQLKRDTDRAAGREAARQDTEGLTQDEIQRRARRQLDTETADQTLDNYRGETDPTKKVPEWSRSRVTGTPGGNIDRVAREQEIIESLTGPSVNPVSKAIVEARVAREAVESITSGGAGLEDIERIKELNIASKKFNRGNAAEEFEVVPYEDIAAFPDATQMVGPDGVTVGYADNNDQFIADSNVNVGSTANAPLSKTATWLEGNLPSYGQEGGTSFGARNVNPGNELRMLNERLGGFGLPNGIRNIADLEQAVRAVTVDAAFSGRTMWNYDQTTGKKVAVRDPGIDEVLYGLNYTGDEKTRLAAALQTVEAAMASPVNSLAKEMYAAGLSPEISSQVQRDGGDEARALDRITNERVGRGKDRVGVRGQLRQLDGSPERVFAGRAADSIYTTAENGERVMLPEARQDLVDARIANSDAVKPFQAAVSGESPKRPAFISAKARAMTPDQRVKQYGANMGGIANDVERRAIEGESVKRQAATKPDPIATEFRKRDQEFAAAGEARRAQDTSSELRKLGLGRYPAGVSMPHAVNETAQVQKSSTNQEPLRGITYNETAPDSWSTPVGTGPGIDSRGPTQGPRTPGVRQKIMNSIKRAPSNFRAAPRNQRYAAVAGGALMAGLGLDGVFGGRQDPREQEAQY